MSNDLLTPPPNDEQAAKTPATVPATPADLKAAAKPNTLAQQQDFHKAKVSEITQLFNRYEDQLKQAAPSLYSAVKREVALVAQFISAPTKAGENLRKCSPASMFGAILTAVTSGLSISHQHYALVPYGGEVQFQLQYQGVNQLVRNYGDVAHVSAYPVNEGDLWEFELGLNPVLRHKPSPDGFNQPVIAAYAIVVYKDGSRRFTVLQRPQIEHLRKKNKLQGDAPSVAWATDYGAMACAKVAKYSMKLEPKSAAASAAFSRDGAIMRVKKEIDPSLGEDGFTDATFAEDGD